MAKDKKTLESLVRKFEDNSATVGIVGMGYVGLPLALRFTEVGINVIGFDTNQTRVNALKHGRGGIKHIDDRKIATAIETSLEVTGDFSRISDVDGIVICVPTPLNKYREPDLSYVIRTCDQIGPFLKVGQVVSLESTTYPGTTREIVVPRLERGGLLVGDSIFCVFSPEREDPGNADFAIRTIPKILGGHTENCRLAGNALYGKAVERIVPLSSTDAAEMTKLLENIHRAVNIGLVNELKVLSDRMGINIFEVIDAASTKPFGFTPYYPGPGLGGHCIPIDPFYLTWKAKEFGLHTRFIELAGEVNSSMPEYVFGKVVRTLNDHGLSVRGAKIMVLGITYKKNVDDTRESPAVVLMEMLRDHGAILSYADPHVPKFPKMRNHHFEISATPLTHSNLSSQDAVILTTDHDDFDYQFIKRSAKVIVDTRGVYREPAANVVRA